MPLNPKSMDSDRVTLDLTVAQAVVVHSVLFMVKVGVSVEQDIPDTRGALGEVERQCAGQGVDAGFRGRAVDMFADEARARREA